MIRFLSQLRRYEALAAAASYAVVALLLFCEIVVRELFDQSIPGSQKMAIFASIFAAFFGLTLATAANAHIRPQFLDQWVPKSWQNWFPRFSDFVAGTVFASTGVVATIYVYDTWDSGILAQVLYIPLWPLQIILPYAFFSSALRYFVFTWYPELKPDKSES